MIQLLEYTVEIRYNGLEGTGEFWLLNTNIVQSNYHIFLKLFSLKKHNQLKSTVHCTFQVPLLRVTDGTVTVFIPRPTRAHRRSPYGTTGGTLAWTVETHISKIILFYVILYYIMNDLLFVIKSDSFI